MSAQHISAQHVLQADTRYIVTRTMHRYENTLCATLFPPDPSQHTADKVWVEDYAHVMRRQPAYTGIDGSPATINYRMKTPIQWDIPVKKYKMVNSVEEDGNADPAINPRRLRQKNALIKARLEREIQCARVVRDPAIMTQNMTLGAGTRFDDILSPLSDPLGVLRKVCADINRYTGLKVDTIQIPKVGALVMCRHAKIQNEAVNKMNLTADRLTINSNIIERLLDDDLIEPGAVKLYDTWFNNTSDGPAASDLINQVYPLGNCVIVSASAKPGGIGGGDFGFGIRKWWNIVKESMPDDPSVQIATGNEGFALVSYPLFEGLGGDQAYLVDASAPFVQNARAAFLIQDAFDAANIAEYGSLFTSF